MYATKIFLVHGTIYSSRWGHGQPDTGSIITNQPAKDACRSLRCLFCRRVKDSVHHECASAPVTTISGAQRLKDIRNHRLFELTISKRRACKTCLVFASSQTVLVEK